MTILQPIICCALLYYLRCPTLSVCCALLYYLRCPTLSVDSTTAYPIYRLSDLIFMAIICGAVLCLVILQPTICGALLCLVMKQAINLTVDMFVGGLVCGLVGSPSGG
jgi:hypothetical protein